MQSLKFSSLALSAALASFAALAASESEPNSNFADRNILLPGDSSFLATITPGASNGDTGYGDYGDGGYGDGGFSLAGDVDFFSFTGLTPGAAFAIDLTAASGAFFDSLVGLFDETGALLAANARFTSNGNTTRSLFGAVGSSGSLNLAVTGRDDRGFEGFHLENAGYDIRLSLGEEFALLPSNDDLSDGTFRFTNVQVENGEIVYIDPEIAVGYDYTTSLINFEAVTLPALPVDMIFQVSFGDGTQQFTRTVASNDEFIFTDFIAGGVSQFSVTGIDVGEMLDPNNPLAFTTGLRFVGNGTTDVTQSAIVIDVSAPTGLALVSFGSLLLWRQRRHAG